MSRVDHFIPWQPISPWYLGHHFVLAPIAVMGTRQIHLAAVQHSQPWPLAIVNRGTTWVWFSRRRGSCMT